MNLLFGIAAFVVAASQSSSVSPAEAQARLVSGNLRFATDQMSHPNVDTEARKAAAKGQHPFAAIVACADSRVGPEIVFDQGIGDLFVIRIAGNVVDEDAMASLEYAVDHLGVKLIVVMGHSKCGAVSAAVASFAPKKEHGEHEVSEFYVPRLVGKILPAVRLARRQPGDLLTNSIHVNESLVVDSIRRAKGGIGHAIHAGQLRVVGAVYNVATNKVQFDDK